jgi:hypothetical protein
MDRVIDIGEGDAIELRLRAPEFGGPDETNGPGALDAPRLRISLRRNPETGPRIEATEAQDVQGFMMKMEPKSDPLNLNNGGPGGGGAPIGLLFEWVSNPTGTFLKYYFKDY